MGRFLTTAKNGKKLIIDRYIIREIVKPTVAICTALIFIYGCFIGTRYLADAVSGQIPGSVVIILILLRIAISLEVLLPTTLYLSVIIAMGRLYKDSEMTALSACGVSTSRVMRPVFSHIFGDCADCFQLVAVYPAVGLQPVFPDQRAGQSEF